MAFAPAARPLMAIRPSPYLPPRTLLLASVVAKARLLEETAFHRNRPAPLNHAHGAPAASAMISAMLAPGMPRMYSDPSPLMLATMLVPAASLTMNASVPAARP